MQRAIKGVPGRTAVLWRPSSEAEAVGTLAVFVEWLRATGRRPDASPDDVRRWAAQEPAGVRQALAAFAAPETNADLLAHILAGAAE